MGKTATDEFGKVTLVQDTAIITAEVSALNHGDVILVPGKGKRGVRQHSNGKLTLVFPRSGKAEVDGKAAGSLRDLDGHSPAVVGYVTGGWATQSTGSTAKPKATPKAKAASNGAPVKGSQEAKDRMAAVRAARKGGSAPKATPKAAPSSNATHFKAALSALATAIEELQQVTL